MTEEEIEFKKYYLKEFSFFDGECVNMRCCR